MVLRKARAWYGRPDFTSGIPIGTSFDYVDGWSEREAKGPGASTLGSGAGREGSLPSIGSTGHGSPDDAARCARFRMDTRRVTRFVGGQAQTDARRLD